MGGVSVYHVYYFQSGANVNDQILDAFCWMHSSFLMPKEYEGSCTTKSEKYEHFNNAGPMYNTYYQWIAIYCVLCGFSFLLPRYNTI